MRRASFTWCTGTTAGDHGQPVQSGESVTRGDRHYLNPIYHAFWLYSVHAGPDLLPATVR